jgi:DNA-binding SARP family transcriptional activator
MSRAAAQENVHEGSRSRSRPAAVQIPRLTVRLFGRIELAVDGVPVRLTGRQAQALAALLVLVRRIRARDAIAADLWPDASSAATGSLRQALWLLRSALGGAGIDPDRILEVDQDALGLRCDLDIDVDVDHFDLALASDPPDAETAVAIYRGDLAECLGHECFARERERLADAFEDALALVAETRLERGRFGAARDAALALVARDPLREEAHATLIRTDGATGTRSQVRRQYRRLRELLRRELDVEPLPETDASLRAAVREAEERSSGSAARDVLRDAGLVVVATSGPDARRVVGGMPLR